MGISLIKDFGCETLPTAVISYAIARSVSFHPAAAAAASWPVIALVDQVAKDKFAYSLVYNSMLDFIGPAFNQVCGLTIAGVGMAGVMLCWGLSVKQTLIAFSIAAVANLTFQTLYYIFSKEDHIFRDDISISTKHFLILTGALFYTIGCARKVGVNPMAAVAYTTTINALDIITSQVQQRLVPSDYEKNPDSTRRFNRLTLVFGCLKLFSALFITRVYTGLPLGDVLPFFGIELIAKDLGKATIELGYTIKKRISDNFFV